MPRVMKYEGCSGMIFRLTLHFVCLMIPVRYNPSLKLVEFTGIYFKFIFSSTSNIIINFHTVRSFDVNNIYINLIAR